MGIGDGLKVKEPVPGPFLPKLIFFMSIPSSYHAPLYVLAFGFIFGTTVSMAKFGSLHGIDPVSLVFWQMAFGGLLLLATALFRGHPVRLGGRFLRYYFVAGLMGNAIPTTLAFVASVKIGAALTGLVYPLSPLTTYVFSIALGIDWIQSRKIAGTLLGLAGAALIVLPPVLASPGTTSGEISILWLLLAFTIPIFLGIGNVYRRMDWPHGSRGLPLAAGMLLATSILMAPLFFFIDAPVWPDLSASIAPWIFAGNILLSYLGFMVYFELQRIAEPVYFSQISYFITIATMIFGFILFDESIEFYVVPSIALIFTGLALVSMKPKKPAKTD
ncbi:DMT family transporter [Sneathiella limimaris]|uniref:DMT family transporter n=1 Tax=Sneathiella limimaris TaxID=1964213 RepID=UPI00146AB791|nr:DMT family transporter [Sneathiella limimaris]